MLKAFVESISALALAGRQPQRLCDASDRRKAVYAMPDGTFHEIRINPPDRVYNLATVAEFVAFAKERCSIGFPAVIFYSESGLRFLQPTEGGEDAAQCALTLSDAWSLLQTCDAPNGAALPQKEFLRMARFVLWVSPAAMDPFRRIDWSQTISGHADLRKGAENLGKSIACTVLTDGLTLPAFLDVEVPIFKTFGEYALHRVRLDVEVSTWDQRIILKPWPGELDRAMMVQLADIRSRIDSAVGDSLGPCEVYQGEAWKKRE